MNLVEKFEQEQIAKLTENKNIPEFGPGDTIRVQLKVTEGNNERLQAYEGVVIARRNSGVNSSCLVRKMTKNNAIERRLAIYSPTVHSIEVVRHGVVRRAKLYYLRDRQGKAARIKEKHTNNK